MDTSNAMEILNKMFHAEMQFMQTDRKNKDEMKAIFHPDIVIHEPEYLPYAGDWCGYEELGRLWHEMSKYWESMKVENLIAMSDNEKLLLSCSLTLVSRSSGEQITQPFSQYLELKNGLVVEATPFYFDTAQINEILKYSKFE